MVYVCADGAWKEEDGVPMCGVGVIAYTKKGDIGKWGNYYFDIVNPYVAEAKSVLFALETCIKQKFKEVELRNDLITKDNLKKNGFGKQFENLAFELNGRLEYYKYENGKDNRKLHVKKHTVADRLARQYREICKQEYQKSVQPKQVA